MNKGKIFMTLLAIVLIIIIVIFSFIVPNLKDDATNDNLVIEDSTVEVETNSSTDSEQSLGDMLLEYEANGGYDVSKSHLEQTQTLEKDMFDFSVEVVDLISEVPPRLTILLSDNIGYEEYVYKCITGLNYYCDKNSLNLDEAFVDYNSYIGVTLDTVFDMYVNVDEHILYVGLKDNTVYIKELK